MSGIRFFALRENLLMPLQTIEDQVPIRYTRTGRFTDPVFETFDSCEDLPNLGTAIGDQSISGECFLIHQFNTKIALRQIPSGGIRNPMIDRLFAILPEEFRSTSDKYPVGDYFVDQLHNPDTVCFRPGGMWGDKNIISGNVDSCSKSEESIDLMRRFRNAFRQAFKATGGYLVGSAALARFRSGARLTNAVQSPPEFDFREST